MSGNKKKSHVKSGSTLLPFVTVCTPTFNRRPFVQGMVACFRHQTYPADRMEWLIGDDGTDPIGDVVSELPGVRYFSWDTKQTLGFKRNFLNDQARGDILVYMDDDDYYPPQRVMHAVHMLQTHPEAMLAGSGAMYMYFKHNSTLYLVGPYAQNRATAATWAFRKSLLATSRFRDDESVAEEPAFLNDYTVPVVQLDPRDTIVVISHPYSTFDKRILLEQHAAHPNPFIHTTSLSLQSLVKPDSLYQFYMYDINPLLDAYVSLGGLDHKPDVVARLKHLETERHQTQQTMDEAYRKQRDTYQSVMSLAYNTCQTCRQHPNRWNEWYTLWQDRAQSQQQEWKRACAQWKQVRSKEISSDEGMISGNLDWTRESDECAHLLETLSTLSTTTLCNDCVAWQQKTRRVCVQWQQATEVLTQVIHKLHASQTAPEAN
jgi:hypothetical protein